MNGVLPIACVIQSEFDYEPFDQEAKSFSVCALKRYWSGEEALRSLQAPSAGQPHLLIVAYNLPLMHGGFFATQCRRFPRLCEVPIVLLAPAGCDDGLVRRLYVDGAQQVVELASERSAWVKTVRSILGYWAVVRPRHVTNRNESTFLKECGT